MNEIFGLGILLTLQDRASRSVANTTENLHRLERQAERCIDSVSALDRANTGLSASNPSATLSEMAQQIRLYTRYVDRYGNVHYRRNRMINVQLQQMTGNANQMARSLENTIRPIGEIASATASGRRVANIMAGFTTEIQTAQRALVGFNAEGTRAISESDTAQALDRYRQRVNDLQASLHGMYQRGEIDALSYQGALRNILTESSRIEQISQRGFRTTGQYFSMLRRAGIDTNAIENMRAVMMERQRTQMMTQARTLLSTRTSANQVNRAFSQVNPILHQMTRGTMGIANSLQRVARYSDPAVRGARLLNQGLNVDHVNAYNMAMANLADGFTTLFPIIAVGLGLYYGALIKLTNDAIPGVGRAWNTFKSSALQALQPVLKMLGAFIIKVLELGTAFMTSIQKFEKLHPLCSKVLSALLLIVPALSFILWTANNVFSRLADIFVSVGGGAGQTAINIMGITVSIAELVGIMATVAGTVGIFMFLWEYCEGFRKAVLGTIDAIKNFVNEFKKAHPTVSAFFENFGQGFILAFVGFTTLTTWAKLFRIALTPLGGLIEAVLWCTPVLRFRLALLSLGGVFTTVFGSLGAILMHPIASMRTLIGLFPRLLTAIQGIIASGSLLGRVLAGLGTLFLHPITTLRAIPVIVAGAFRALPGIVMGALTTVQTAIYVWASNITTIMLDIVRHPITSLRLGFIMLRDVAVTSFTRIGTALRWFGTLLLRPITAIRQLGTAIMGLASRLPFSPWIIVIAIVTTAILALWKTNEDFRKAIHEIWGGICNFVSGVINGVKQAMEGSLKPVIENLKSIMTSLGTIFGTIFGAISEVLNAFFTLITGKGIESINVLELVVNIISGALQGAINILNVILTPLAEGLKKVAEFMNKNREAITNGLLTAFNILASTIGSILMPIITLFKELWKEYGDTLQNTVIEAVQTLAQFFSGVLAGALKIVGEIVKAITDYWKEHSEIIDTIKNAYNQVQSIITQVISTLVSLVKPVIEQLGSIWEEHGSTIIDSLSELANALMPIIGAIVGILTNIVIPVVCDVIAIVIKALAGVINFIATNLPTILQIVTTVINGIVTVITVVIEVITTVASVISTVVSGVVSVVSKLLQGDFAGAWKSLVGIITGVAGEIWSCITGVFGKIGKFLTSINWAELGLNIIQGLVDGIIGALSFIWDAVEQIGTTLVDGVKNLLGIHSPSTVFYEIGMNVLEGLANGITAGIQFLQTAIQSIMQVFIDLKDNLIQAWNEAKANVIEIVTTLIFMAQQKFQDMKESVIDKVTELKNRAITLWNNLKATVVGIVENLKQSAINKWNDIKSGVISIVTNLKQSAVNLFNSMKEAIAKKVADVKTKIVNKFNEIKKWLQNFSLVDVGKNIIQGLINGVSSKLGSLKTTITNGVASAKKSACNFLGINSPSRVFKEIGQFTIQGYNLGVEQEARNTPEVIKNALPDEQVIKQYASPIQNNPSSILTTNNQNNAHYDNSRTSNDTINFNVTVENGKDFTKQDAEKMWDMIQEVRKYRALFQY